MPGIVGLITRKPRSIAEGELRKMIATLLHEPSYSSGIWIDEFAGVYIGWVARQGSFAEGMPLIDEQDRRVLIFAGEEYPDPTIRSGLRQRGHSIEGETGPAYLVHLAEEDPAFPRSLNGRFHGLFVDRHEGRARLFNDRYGMLRLYVHENSEAFYFSAEAKALLAVRPELRRFSQEGLGEFVSCGAVLENRSIFEDIRILPQGSSWDFRRGALERKQKYFDPSEWENQGSLDSESYYEQLRHVFSQNLPRYFSGTEKMGISLTGGLDTRMIMAWAKAPANLISGYTFGGPYRECHDVAIGRKVAQSCHLPYQVIPLDEDFLSRFPYFAERAIYLTDGCVSVNRAADLYANEFAARIAPVRMTGNYGSEILRRLRAFKPATPAPGLLTPEFVESVNRTKGTFDSLFGRHAVTFTAFCQAPWYQYSLLALEQTQLTVRSPFLDNDLVQTAFRAPGSEIVKSDLFEDNDACARLIQDGSRDLYAIPTDRGLGGRRGWVASLRRGILEFSFKAEYAYDYGMPQWLAKIDRRLSMLHIENLILGRHKFCHYRVWYRDQLANYVKDVLLDPVSRSRPYLMPGTLEAMVNRHIRGDRNYTTEITRLLTLELQHRLFVDAAPVEKPILEAIRA